MKIDELKSELKEKENELKRDENGEICLWEEERETIRKEISALKKGISACEELEKERKMVEWAYSILNNEHTLLLKAIGLKENATHEQIVNACEEILNSQQNINHKVNSEKDIHLSKLIGLTEKTGSADTQTLIKKRLINRFKNYTNNKNTLNTFSDDLDLLIKQALSQRNKEILEIIDHEIKEEMEAIDKNVIRQTWDIVDELRYLKQQLTNSEGKE